MTERSLSTRTVPYLPLLIFIFVHVIVTPLREIYSIEPLLMIPYYGLAILIGVVIYRKSRVVRDYEFQRSKVMKKMKEAYKAEESGVWQANVDVSSEIENQSNLALNVSSLSSEPPELEVNEDSKVEIDMLNESEKIVEATRRVSGQSSFDDEEVQSTIGATRSASPMDRFLDMLSGIFGKKASEKRDLQRKSALTAAAKAAPVSASRINAPIQTVRNNEEISSDDEDIINYEDSNIKPKVETSVGQPVVKDYSAFSGVNQTNQQSQSIEEMAMIGINKKPISMISSVNSANCPKCGYKKSDGDRYCLNCGASL